MMVTLEKKLLGGDDTYVYVFASLLVFAYLYLALHHVAALVDA